MRKPMRQKFRQVLRFACVGVAAAAAGLVAGWRLGRPPARAPVRASAAEAALDKVLPEVNLVEVPFDQAVEELQRVAGVRLVVRWDALASRGWNDRTRPVTIRARGITLSQALRRLTEYWDADGYWLTWAPDGDAVVFSTLEDIASLALTLRVYDVHDLTGAGGPFNWGGSPCGTSGDPGLSELEDWLDGKLGRDPSGGNGPRMRDARYIGGRLIVQDTWLTHAEIARLLTWLRQGVSRSATPPPLTPDLALWDDTLKRYVPILAAAGEASLGRRLGDIRLDNVPLEQATAALGEQAGTAVIGDWAATEASGTSRAAPVTLHLHNVTLARALRAALDAAGGTDLTFGPAGGHVLVTSGRYADRVRVTRTYDVRDWLAACNAPAAGRMTDRDLIESLAAALRQNVDRRAWGWGAAEGEAGDVTALNGWLIVTRPWETEEKVADFLAAVRCDAGKLRAATELPATKPTEGSVK